MNWQQTVGRVVAEPASALEQYLTLWILLTTTVGGTFGFFAPDLLAALARGL